VHPDASQQTGGWPFSVVLDDEQLQNAANGGLYQLSSPETALQAPADVAFTWSMATWKSLSIFRFDHTYVIRVETSVKLNGKPLTAGLGWLRRLRRFDGNKSGAGGNGFDVLQRGRKINPISPTRS